MERALTSTNLKLLAFETKCDVILSCQDCKLEAHKLILSIASPLMRDILEQTSEYPAILIFPEVSSRTMTFILDYIYSGTIKIHSKELEEFMKLASLLRIQIDFEHLEKIKNFVFKNENPALSSEVEKTSTTLPKCQSFQTDKLEFLMKDSPNFNYSSIKYLQSNEAINYSSQKSDLNECKKPLRKIPNLMPISAVSYRHKTRIKGLYNQASPSPWCPRNVSLLASPRQIECFSYNKETSHLQIQQSKLLPTENNCDKNDSNNNFTCTTAFRKKSITNNIIIPQPLPIIPTSVTNSSTYNRLPEKPPSVAKSQSKSLLSSSVLSSITSQSPNKEVRSTEKINTVKNKEIDEKDQLICCESNLKHTPVTELDQKVCEEKEIIKRNSKNTEKPFKCQDCGKNFSQLRNFKYHRSIHEGTKEFAARCPECGKLFNDRGYLSSHLKIHRDRKEYACPQCPKRFNQRVAYNMHLRVHTGLKPHECPTCGKGFSRKMLLKQHQRVHTGERPYSCPECGKTFADRSNMSLHQRLHTGIKPYTCSVCPKSFTKKHHLKTHMNFHTGLKPYSCQNCGLAFSQSSNMRTHYKKCVMKSNNNASVEGSTDS